MAAGIPGVGVGGLFYVVSALLAPLHVTLPGKSSDADPTTVSASSRRESRVAALRLFTIAAAIVAATWLTGLLVGALLQAIGASPTDGSPASLWKVSAFVVSAGTLTLVLGLVQVTKGVVRWKNARSLAA